MVHSVPGETISNFSEKLNSEACKMVQKVNKLPATSEELDFMP